MKYAISLLMIAGMILLGGACRVRTNTAAIDPTADACALLPADALSSIQGERVLQVEPSRTVNGDLTSRRCFYRTENFSRSVDLEIITGSGDSVSEFWNKRFHSSEPDEDEEETRGTSSFDEREQAEKRVKAQPSIVPGSWDEAYWISNQLNSTFFARQNGSVVRISLGGAEDQELKLEHAEAIAARVLAEKP